jgi:hypothetical protein
MSDDSFYDDFDYSCGVKDTMCTCWDCTVYFNKDTNRPTKSKDITDEEFKELLQLCSDEKVLGIMKKERYKSVIYEIVPYPMWKKLENEETYNAIVKQLETTGDVPDEQPEICHVGTAIHVDLDGNELAIKTIAYRFPTSTVKYELIVNDVNGKRLLRTHSRGSEIKN